MRLPCLRACGAGPLALAGLLAAAELARAGPAAPDDAAPAAVLVPAGSAFPLPPPPGEEPPARSPGPEAVVVGAPGVEAAGEGEQPGPSAGPPADLTPLQAQTLAYQMKTYLRQVHERVGRVWVAPRAPVRAPRREALVTVVINRCGRVVEARVDRASSDDRFDRSALHAVGRPNLFPPLPPYYQTDVLEVGLRFADPSARGRAR